MNYLSEDWILKFQWFKGGGVCRIEKIKINFYDIIHVLLYLSTDKKVNFCNEIKTLNLLNVSTSCMKHKCPLVK